MKIFNVVMVQAILLAGLSACGGGGGESPSPPVVTPPPVNIKPTASITKPTNGDPALYGNISVESIVEDTDGTVTKAELMIDGTSVITITSPSRSPVFNLDSVQLLTDGVHSFVVKVTDSNNAIGNSSPVTVTIDNSAAVTFSIGRHRISPSAVYDDGLCSTPITYEIEMEWSGTASVQIDRNEFVVGNKDFALFPITDDDNDGIWNVTFVPGICGLVNLEKGDGLTGDLTINLIFFNEKGVTVLPILPGDVKPSAVLGVVDSSVIAPLMATDSPNIMRTRAAIFGKVPTYDGTMTDLPTATQYAYNVYPDDRWDWLFAVNLGWSYGSVPRGDGIAASDFGSSGNLDARAWLDDSLDLEGALHEIFHRWLFYFIDSSLPLNRGAENTGHMGVCDVAGIMSQSKITVNNGDGTSTVQELRTAQGKILNQRSLRLTEISAYWIGALSDFKPFRCVTDLTADISVGSVISNASFTTVDKIGLESFYGPPPMSFETGQKAYSGIMFGISQDSFPDAATAAYITAKAEQLAGTSAGYMTSTNKASTGGFWWATYQAFSLTFPTDP